MTVKNVHLNNSEIKRIYYESFKPNERMPFFMMVMMSKIPNTDFIAFYDGETPCGFIYYAIGITQIFVMFFAVDEKMRGHGCGKYILDYIAEKYPKKNIIVSIGDENSSESEKISGRKAFYQKCGFSESGFYIRMNGINEEILTRNGKFSKIKLRLFLALYSCGSLWPPIRKK